MGFLHRKIFNIKTKRGDNLFLLIFFMKYLK